MLIIPLAVQYMKNNLLIQSAKHPRNEKGLWTLLDVFILLPLIYLALAVPGVLLLNAINKISISNYTLETLRFSGGNLVLQFMIMIVAICLVMYITEKRSILTLGLKGEKRLQKYIFGFYTGVYIHNKKP